MHLLPRILSQFPDTEIPVQSAPWRGKLFLLHRCRTYPAFSTLPERTAAVVLFLPGFSADPGETDVFPSGYVLLFFLRFPPECFFRSFFVCLLDISVQLSFGNFKKSDRLMFPFISLPIGIADFSSASIIFKSRYLI